MTYNDLLNQMMTMSDEQLNYPAVANFGDLFGLVDDVSEMHQLLHVNDKLVREQPVLVCAEMDFDEIDNISHNFTNVSDNDEILYTHVTKLNQPAKIWVDEEIYDEDLPPEEVQDDVYYEDE